MAAWPEFYFDSEFESASEYSTHTPGSSPVPNCQVTLSLLWNHNTQTYQSSRHDTVSSSKQGSDHSSEPSRSSKPQPHSIDPDQPQQEQPPNTCQPSVDPAPDQSQPPDIQSQMQPPVASQRRDQSQRLPPKYGIQSQPPAAKKQPPKSQPQSQPPDLPPDPDSSVSKEDWGKGSIDPG